MQRYMRPLLERVQNGEIDPRFVVTHRMRLVDAPEGYQTFRDKRDDWRQSRAQTLNGTTRRSG